MFLAGFDSPITLRLFLVRGGFYGFGLWEVKMLWVQIMGVTLVWSEQRFIRRKSAELNKNIAY
jgi:hypothetical protein